MKFFGYSLWIFSWWGAYNIAAFNSWGSYVFCTAISMHIRVPSPLGQVPPLLDATASAFISKLSCLLALLCLLIAIQTLDMYFFLSAVLFFATFLSNRKVENGFRFFLQEFRRNITDYDGSMSIQLPFLIQLHPYLMRYRMNDMPGIKIDNFVDHVDHVDVDIWHGINDDRTKKPILFYIHGGGWKGGSTRIHSQVRLLSDLVSQGWVIVACNYRKNKWPEHLDDCKSSFLWMSQNISKYGGEISAVHICGASAGGHLASLLFAQLHQEGLVSNREPMPSNADNKASLEPSLRPFVRSLLLFYPAVDPVDDLHQTTTFPVSIPFLKILRGQSLMNWFFERLVLGDDKSLWTSASPLRIIASSGVLRREWPPTLTVHGSLDSIVPIEQSYALLNLLQDDIDFRPKMTIAESADHSVNRSHESNQLETAKNFDSSPVKSVHSLLGGYRSVENSKHGLLECEGLKHSFECAGTAVVDTIVSVCVAWIASRNLKASSEIDDATQ